MKTYKRVRFYLGTGYTKTGEPVPQESIGKALNYITASFGGATFYAGAGTWKDPKTGQIVSEPCQVAEVVADPADAPAEFVEYVAASLRDILQQSAVLYTVEPGIFGEFI